MPYTHNLKLGDLRNFDCRCNSRIKNDLKNELRQKLEGFDMVLPEKKFSEVTEFSIFPYT